MKTFRAVVLAAFAVMLAGCATNVINRAPIETPKKELAAVEQAIAKAKAAQQCSTLAEQTRNLLLAKASLHESKKWIYEERKKGRDYGPEMKKEVQKAIVSGWRLAGETVKLYSLSTSWPELSDETRTLAKTMFEVTAVNDEISRLGLAYTIAGMEWNAGFLTTERETHFNSLIKKEAEMANRESILTKNFVSHLAAQAGSGKATVCPPLSVSSEKGGVNVLSGDSPNEKGLREVVLRTAEGTSLGSRNKRVVIVLKNVDMGSEAARTVANVFTFALMGYSRGGDAFLSAIVQEEGGKSIPLITDSIPINAKSTEHLNLLAAYWVIGQAEFALLRQDMR